VFLQGKLFQQKYVESKLLQTLSIRKKIWNWFQPDLFLPDHTFKLKQVLMQNF
jgi:hypothetical protein